jgi:uncharacterized protein YraI
MYARISGRCLLALLSLACASSFAQEAFTRQAANVRAGPDRSYPLVAQLPPGAPLRVLGCLEDWTWCDVAFDDNRGWVYGPFLLYAVPDDRVSLYTYGPSLGVPIIGFSLGGYWDDHYRQRPWYGGRSDWERRAPPPHQAPAGLPPHATYTPGMHPDRGGARPTGRPPGAGPARAEQHAPAGPAQGPPARENSRGSPEHADPQAPRDAPRPMMQHAPTQQRAPMQQQAPTQQRPPAQQQAPAPQRAATQQQAPAQQRTPMQQQAPTQQRPPMQQQAPTQQRPPMQQQAPTQQRAPMQQQAPMQQHQPAQQREPSQQREPAQGRESGAQRGPERGGGGKGGAGKPDREAR